MDDRTTTYVKALDDLDQLLASKQISQNEWDVRRAGLLNEANPSVGASVGRFVYILLGAVLLVVIVLLILALAF